MFAALWYEKDHGRYTVLMWRLRRMMHHPYQTGFEPITSRKTRL